MKAAIFDMDGTLLDSMSVWRGLGEAYLLTLGITPPQDLSKTIKSLSFSDTAKYFIEHLNIDETEKAMIGKWNEMAIDKYRKTVQLKPFVKEYLERLEQMGVKMCVATATEKIIANEILEKFGILSKFEFVITESEVGAGKTSPEIFTKAAELLGEEIGDCVVFEDACHAIKTAKQAGFTVYAIEDGESAEHKDEILKWCDKYLSTRQLLNL